MKPEKNPEKVNLDALLKTRVTPTEKELVGQRAADKNMDVSDYMRHCLHLKRRYYPTEVGKKNAENEPVIAKAEQVDTKLSFLLRRLDTHQASSYTPQQKFLQYLDTQGLTLLKDPLNGQPSPMVNQPLTPVSDARIEIQIKTLFFIQQTVVKLSDYVCALSQQANPRKKNQLSYEASGLLSTLYDKLYDHDR